MNLIPRFPKEMYAKYVAALLDKINELASQLDKIDVDKHDPDRFGVLKSNSNSNKKYGS